LIDFAVVDTEGKGIIEEIAIIDSSGDLIVEEFIDENLKDVLLKIKPILESNLIVAHTSSKSSRVLFSTF